MKQVLFEEDGAFRVGTILAEAGASFQVEAAHGKRSKIKANAILLRFDGQSLSGFMPEAGWGQAKVRASTWLHENEMSMSFWTPGWGEKEMPISE